MAKKPPKKTTPTTAGPAATAATSDVGNPGISRLPQAKKKPVSKPAPKKTTPTSKASQTSTTKGAPAKPNTSTTATSKKGRAPTRPGSTPDGSTGAGSSPSASGHVIAGGIAADQQDAAQASVINQLRAQGYKVKSTAQGIIITQGTEKKTIQALGKDVNPKTFVTTQTPNGPVDNYARYYAGDENAPALLNPDQQTGLKSALKELGYYDKSWNPSPGTGWRQDTDAVAMARLMGEANATGKTYTQLLADNLALKDQGAQFPNSGSSGGGGGGGGGGSINSAPDAEQIRQALDSEAVKIIGHRIDPATREQMVGELGKTYIDPGQFNLTSEVQKSIRTHFGGEATGQDIGGVLQTVAGMLGLGGGWGISPSYGASPVGPATGASMPGGVPATSSTTAPVGV